jgi:hypothetical protein
VVQQAICFCDGRTKKIQNLVIKDAITVTLRESLH